MRPAGHRRATPVRFDIEGQISRPSSGTFTGTIDVDTALGTVMAASILFPVLAAFDVLRVSLAQVNQAWRVRVDNADRDVLSFFFTTTLASGRLGSLIDFDGGSVTQGTLSGPGIDGTVIGFSGSLTPTRTVPEPATLGMFGAKVLLRGPFVGRRRRYYRAGFDPCTCNATLGNGGCLFSGPTRQVDGAGIPLRSAVRTRRNTRRLDAVSDAVGRLFAVRRRCKTPPTTVLTDAARSHLEEPSAGFTLSPFFRAFM